MIIRSFDVIYPTVTINDVDVKLPKSVSNFLGFVLLDGQLYCCQADTEW
jgi:hypothetical protein